MTPSASVSRDSRVSGVKKGCATAGLLLGQEPEPWFLQHILLFPRPPAPTKSAEGSRCSGQRASLAPSPPPRLCCWGGDGGRCQNWADLGRNCSWQEGMGEGQLGGDRGHGASPPPEL